MRPGVTSRSDRRPAARGRGRPRRHPQPSRARARAQQRLRSVRVRGIAPRRTPSRPRRRRRRPSLRGVRSPLAKAAETMATLTCCQSAWFGYEERKRSQHADRLVVATRPDEGLRLAVAGLGRRVRRRGSARRARPTRRRPSRTAPAPRRPRRAASAPSPPARRRGARGWRGESTSPPPRTQPRPCRASGAPRRAAAGSPSPARRGGIAGQRLAKVLPCVVGLACRLARPRPTATAVATIEGARSRHRLLEQRVPGSNGIGVSAELFETEGDALAHAKGLLRPRAPMARACSVGRQGPRRRPASSPCDRGRPSLRRRRSPRRRAARAGRRAPLAPRAPWLPRPAPAGARLPPRLAVAPRRRRQRCASSRPVQAESPCSFRKRVVRSSASRGDPAFSSARASSTHASRASSVPGYDWRKD